MKKVFAILLIVMFAFPSLSSFATVSFLMGDVNGDGELSAEDARLTLRASVGLEQYREGAYAFIAADVNNDGMIRPDDARSILRAVVRLEILPGKIINFPDAGQQTTKIFIDTNSGKIVPTIKASEKNTHPNTIPSTTQSSTPLVTMPAYELNTTVPVQPVSTVSEFDYLKGGNFYMQGTMTDKAGQLFPLKMAVTPNSVYELSHYEGATVGMLINDKGAYMIYPAEKSYLKLSADVTEALGMETEDLLVHIDPDFSQYDLSRADAAATENLNGKNCTVYSFNDASGSTRFYLNGNKLVRFSTYDANGNPDTVYDIGFISDQVPADKTSPPSEYKKYSGLTGMSSFISLLGDAVGE